METSRKQRAGDNREGRGGGGASQVISEDVKIFLLLFAQISFQHYLLDSTVVAGDISDMSVTMNSANSSLSLEKTDFTTKSGIQFLSLHKEQ